MIILFHNLSLYDRLFKKILFNRIIFYNISYNDILSDKIVFKNTLFYFLYYRNVKFLFNFVVLLKIYLNNNSLIMFSSINIIFSYIYNNNTNNSNTANYCK